MSNVYSISFRIAEQQVGGRSYEQRYAALEEAIKGLVSGKYWDRTTSFFLIQTAKDIDAIATACGKVIAPTHDLVVVLDANVKAARVIGNNTDDDIYTILPFAKKA